MSGTTANEQRKRILVGDSESWALALFEQAAALHRVELHTVRNGIEAVEKFKTLAPQLVVMDTLLPKLDGLQVASKIHDTELGRITPIIVTSAIFRRGPEVEQLRRNFGFTDFLEKPFQLEELNRLLEIYLNEEPDAPDTDREADETGEPLATPEHAEMQLSEMGMAALLMQLFRARKSGILCLRREEITKVLFFDNGYLTHARSNSRRDLLGRTLLRSHRIAMEDYDRARALQLESSGHLQLGAALAQLGVLNEHEVISAVSRQVLGIVFSLFGWRGGSWSFVETNNIPAAYKRFSFNPANIAFWGLRQLEGRVKFGRYLPSDKMIIEVADTAAELKDSLHLTYFEEQILGLVDGRHQLGEIVSIGRLAHLDVERVIFSLLVVGLLRVRRREPAQHAEEVEEAVAQARPIETEGNLQHTSVARLFSRICNASISGRVRFQNGDLETSVWFDRGEIIYGRATAEQFLLANILLRAGKVTQSDYDQAMRMLIDQTSKKVGAIFLELRALSLEELHWALRFQVQAIVLDLFTWSIGTYVLEPGEPRLDLRVSLDATTPNLIMEGARSTAAPPGILAMLQSSDTLLVKVWGDYSVTRLLQLSSAEMRLLSFIEVGRSVQEIRNLGIMSDDELGQTLHGLLALEVVRATRDTGAQLAHPPAQGSLVDRHVGEEEEEEVTGEMKIGRVAAQSPPGPPLEEENRTLRVELEQLRAQMAALQQQAASKTPDPDDEPTQD